MYRPASFDCNFVQFWCFFSMKGKHLIAHSTSAGSGVTAALWFMRQDRWIFMCCQVRKPGFMQFTEKKKGFLIDCHRDGYFHNWMAFNFPFVLWTVLDWETHRPLSQTSSAAAALPSVHLLWNWARLDSLLWDMAAALLIMKNCFTTS